MTAEEREEWHRDQEALAREAAEGQESASGATETGARAERVPPDPARVARYAEAIGRVYQRHNLAIYAKAVIPLADSELAALMAERGEMRAEVERLRGEVERVRALADAFADDGLMRHGGNVAWHIEEAIANEKSDFPDAADRRIASQRDRAEAAEAKVARARLVAFGTDWSGFTVEAFRDEIRAILADAPAEQRAEGGA